MPIRRPLLLSCLSLAALLAACGGGGDSAESALSGATGSTASTDCGQANFQAELLQRINALRAAGASCGSSGTFPATTPLTWNTQLTAAAAAHSADMAAKNYFEHTSADGTTMSQRVSNAGYAWSRVAENIAAGYGTVEAVMTGWANSPGHCANLMNANLREVGVACVPGTSTSDYANYWTMDLATPQ